MNRIYYSAILIILFLLLSTENVRASSYVLPYPSFMPGNFMYQPKLILDKLTSLLYFGDFGKFDYNLKRSDHYLVESKTLFEYGQYLLAYQALQKSELYFKNIKPSLLSARKHGKDTSDKTQMLKEASLKHIEVLTKLKNELPKTYDWKEENTKAETLELEKSINRSIQTRKSL